MHRPLWHFGRWPRRAAAIRRVASAATNILAGYGTTEEEDLERLGDVDPVVLGIVDDRHDAYVHDRPRRRRGVGRGAISPKNASTPRTLLAREGSRQRRGVLVALRVRERRMLRGAVLALRDRAETLGRLDFQVEEKEAAGAERKAFERERGTNSRTLQNLSRARCSRVRSTSTSCTTGFVVGERRIVGGEWDLT